MSKPEAPLGTTQPRENDPDKQRGLYEKFIVTRNRPSEKHKNCRYFVLDLDHDELSVPAIKAYAAAAQAAGYIRLAEDLRAKLPIDRPCSACSAGDTEMKYHDHAPPFRVDAAPATSPWRTGTPDNAREVLTRKRYEGMLIYSLATFSSSYNKPYTRRWWSDDDEKIAVDEWMDIPTGEAPPAVRKETP